MRETASIVRPQSGRDSHRVTFVELFFDLVFVFAITQLSHALIEHPSLPVLLQTLLLTVALWWMWINTAWVTNWLHPEHPAVRGLLLSMMFAALLLGTAIPDAFGDGAVLFALCYVVIEVGRSVFTAVALRRDRPENSLGFVRISIWQLAAASLWIAGALLPDARGWLWLAAVALYSAGPSARYALPGLGATPVRVWHISGEHMAERAALFLIIVLGESIIVTGTAFDDVPLDPVSISAFAAAFASTVLMWLLYFNHRERRGSEYISSTDANGAIGRLAYTYIHVLLVIGILLTAVADELVLLHPLGEHEEGHATTGSSPWVAGLICGAAAVYLIGNALFTWAVKGPMLVSHYLGAAALAALFALHPLLSPLALNWLSNLVLLVVVIADQLLWRRLGREGEVRTADEVDETI
ncbi:low temperature requirement protein A [Herbiconiux sp. L3-i23]|uniref:low temperature requirement protein A n=1 Tax=Herbiconiux sp. L3-i23 TaxID=2905871 RepID=UPI00204AC009|nr:low temperature requirement protein A [Herbiconiux sp. L3-i23]BDI21803.1 membrane protein [Herbiconiux sp. L3-i23]